MAKEQWIDKMHMDKGAFTAEAKKRSMTAAELQRAVLAHPDRYPRKLVKQANLRKTLVRMK